MSTRRVNDRPRMSPLETVQCFYAALGRGDVDAVLALLKETIEWREAEGFPYFGGTWTRPHQVARPLLLPQAGRHQTRRQEREGAGHRAEGR